MQYVKEFMSIHEFYDYLCKTPFNDAFECKFHASVSGSFGFTGTKSFDHAVELLKNGWSGMSKKLTQKLKVASKPATQMKPRNVLSVAGYQPIVPLYLAGVPTNMVNKQLVTVKSKVVTVTKLIDYSCNIATSKIEEESIKAMQIVRRLEAQGYRVNLNVGWGTCAKGNEIILKVRIKNANEKLNVSKLAFPMVHPSMLRRLFFRYLEVCPDTTEDFLVSYGTPPGFSDMKKAFPDDVVLPSIWDGDIDKVSDLGSLQATF